MFLINFIVRHCHRRLRSSKILKTFTRKLKKFVKIQKIIFVGKILRKFFSKKTKILRNSLRKMSKKKLHEGERRSGDDARWFKSVGERDGRCEKCSYLGQRLEARLLHRFTKFPFYGADNGEITEKQVID